MRKSASVCTAFILATLCCAGQESKALADLSIESSASARVWVRYVVKDLTAVRSGWIVSRDAEHPHTVTNLRPSPTNHIRGIVYSPGCALQTFDQPIQDARSYQYVFHCEPIPKVEIHGTVPYLGKLFDHDFKVEAKYVPDWASDFFGYDDGTTTEIPLGPAVALDEGEIRIFIRDQVTVQIVDQLRVASRNPKVQASRLGGIRIESLKVDGGVFAFCPTKSTYAHDEFGFALRHDDDDGCPP